MPLRRLVTHRIFQPSAAEPLAFDATIEAMLLHWQRRFDLRAVKYDPYQMQAVAQRLSGHGVPMVEFAQSTPNLTEASTNVYSLVKGRNLVVYVDDALGLAVSRAVAVESSRGWRVTKEKASHKIDVVVALEMAALPALHEGGRESLSIWGGGEQVIVRGRGS